MSNISSELENWSYSLMSLYGQLSKLSRKQDANNEQAISKLLSLLSPTQCEDCLPSLYVQHYFTLTREDAEMVFGTQYSSKGTPLLNSLK